MYIGSLLSIKAILDLSAAYTLKTQRLHSAQSQHYTLQDILWDCKLYNLKLMARRDKSQMVYLRKREKLAHKANIENKRYPTSNYNKTL